MRVFSLPDPVYKTEPLVLCNCSRRAAERYLQRRFKWSIEIDDGSTATVLSRSRAPWRVVWIETVDNSLESLGTIVHELFHLTVRVCRDKGIPIVANWETGEVGDEAAAYLLDYYTREFLDRAGLTR